MASCPRRVRRGGRVRSASRSGPRRGGRFTSRNRLPCTDGRGRDGGDGRCGVGGDVLDGSRGVPDRMRCGDTHFFGDGIDEVWSDGTLTSTKHQAAWLRASHTPTHADHRSRTETPFHSRDRPRTRVQLRSQFGSNFRSQLQERVQEQPRSELGAKFRSSSRAIQPPGSRSGDPRASQVCCIYHACHVHHRLTAHIAHPAS